MPTATGGGLHSHAFTHSDRQAGRQTGDRGGGRQVVNQVHESCRQGVQDWSETYLNT